MSEKRKVYRPNTTQVPNILLDEVMADLDKSELKCLLYAVRRIYGFHKEGDFIAMSQFETGITRMDGTRLDKGTGLDRKSIRMALKGLIKKGLLSRTAWCQKCKKVITRNWCECKARKMMQHYFTIPIEEYAPELRGDKSPLELASGGMVPGLRVNNSQFKGEKITPQNLEKERETRDKTPNADPQKSASAQECQKAYGNIYGPKGPEESSGSAPVKKPTISVMDKHKDPFKREPNPKAEAAFRKFGTASPLQKKEKDEVSDADPGVKYNCMDCGARNEFHDKDEALEGKCLKCGKLIFQEEKK